MGRRPHQPSGPVTGRPPIGQGRPSRPRPGPPRRSAPPPSAPLASSGSGGGAVFFKGILKVGLVVGLVVLLFGTLFNSDILSSRGGLGLAGRDDDHAIRAMDAGHPMIGAWLGDWPTDENDKIREFDDDTGGRLDVVDVFLDWKTPYDNVSYTIEYISSHGALAMLTWEPRDFTHDQIVKGTARIPLRDGRAVSIDDYLAEFADGLCKTIDDLDEPVLMRTLHEMNGGWYPWGIGYTVDGKRVNSDDSFKQAWIKVHDTFESRCPGDVRFVYTINHFSGPETTFMGGYPGDQYVDFIGIDGYNWGSKAPWGWQSFATVYNSPYCAVVRQTDKPIIVAEMAASESGGDKARWINETYQGVMTGKYPQIQIIVYFNEAKQEIEVGNAVMDWPYDTSEASRASFIEQVRSVQAVRDTGGDGWRPPAGNAVC